MVAKQAVQGNLQRDRGLRAVMETVCGLAVLVKLSPRLAWVFGLVIPFVAWGLVSMYIRRVEGVALTDCWCVVDFCSLFDLFVCASRLLLFAVCLASRDPPGCVVGSHVSRGYGYCVRFVLCRYNVRACFLRV